MNSHVFSKEERLPDFKDIMINRKQRMHMQQVSYKRKELPESR